jgi:hypothetical protein
MTGCKPLAPAVDDSFAATGRPKKQLVQQVI